MKKLVAALAALILAATASLPASAFTPNKGESVMMTVAEESTVGNQSNIGYWNEGPDKNEPGQAIIQCSGTRDPKCDFDKADIDTRSVFPPCETNSDVACVEGLELAVAGGTFVAAKLIGEAGGGMKIPADPAVNFLRSGSPAKFEVEGVPNSAGANTYAVVLKGRQNYDKRSRKWSLTNIVAAVIPTKEVSDPKYGNISEDGNGSGWTNQCAYFESGACGTAVDFVDGTQVRVSFRIPKTVGGWFRGRVKAPTIDVKSISAKANQITVSGQAVVVPRLLVPLTDVQLKEPKNQWLTKISNWGADGYIAAGFGGNEEGVFKFIDHMRPYADDTATKTTTSWDISSTDGGSGSGCLNDKSRVLGIVTTNALGYDGSSPSFTGGFLNYKVSGLHYLPGGKDLALGTYDLVMRSDTARCLYGFSKAPLSATVSVTGGAGSKNVATTVVSEKNGWLKMAAYGFTFSKKTIKVKITKKKK